MNSIETHLPASKKKKKRKKRKTIEREGKGGKESERKLNNKKVDIIYINLNILLEHDTNRM
jgi:hypothetical protein